MQVECLLNEQEIKAAIAEYVQAKYGVSVDPNHILVRVKSKQNYKSEWEEAAIKCEFAAPAREHNG